MKESLERTHVDLAMVFPYEFEGDRTMALTPVDSYRICRHVADVAVGTVADARTYGREGQKRLTMAAQLRCRGSLRWLRTDAR